MRNRPCRNPYPILTRGQARLAHEEAKRQFLWAMELMPLRREFERREHEEGLRQVRRMIANA